jgi:hypothetical protein
MKTMCLPALLTASCALKCSLGIEQAKCIQRWVELLDASDHGMCDVDRR